MLLATITVCHGRVKAMQVQTSRSARPTAKLILL